MSIRCIIITKVPIVSEIPGISEMTYGGAEIDEEPRLARIESEIPNATMNIMNTKLT